MRARQATVLAIQRELDLELAQVAKASEAASAHATRIADAGAALRALHVYDVRMRRAVVARLSDLASPVSISVDVSGARCVDRPHTASGGSGVAAAVAPARVPTGSVDSRGFAFHRHAASSARQSPTSTMPSETSHRAATFHDCGHRAAF